MLMMGIVTGLFEAKQMRLANEGKQRVLSVL